MTEDLTTQLAAYDILTFFEDPAHPFSVETGRAICQHVQAGGTLSSYCQEHGLPVRVAQTWLHSAYEVPLAVLAFRQAFKAARHAQGDILGDSLLDLVDEEPGTTSKGDVDGAAVKNKELRVSVRRELAAQLSPEVWGPVSRSIVASKGNLTINATTNVLELSDEALERIISEHASQRARGSDSAVIDVPMLEPRATGGDA